MTETELLASTKPATIGFIGKVLHHVARATGQEMNVRIEEAIAPLLSRIAELEARPVLRYVGVYREGVGYVSGSVCTHGGSMWHAERTTTARPGESDDWVLCVKHGRDLR